MNKPVIIIGNGGHAAVLTEILINYSVPIIGFTAMQRESNEFHLNYLGTDEVILNYDKDEVELVLGIGSITVSNKRKKIFLFFKSKGYFFKNIIHPTAIIAPSVNLGEGVQIMAGSILQTKVCIADNTIINTGVRIDHHSKISSNVHIAPGSILSGNVCINDGAHIGPGTTIIQGINIGENALVGAGAVVVKSVGDDKKAIGIPAREF